MNSNTTSIARKLAEQYPELTVKAATAYLRTAFSVIKQATHELEPDSRERVSLDGLGNFGVKRTKERSVKVINSDETRTVPAGLRISFKPAASFKENVGEGFEVETFDTKTFSKPKAEGEAPAKEAPAKAPAPAPATAETPADLAEELEDI